jgi:Domain of unknown function (DUF4179)
MGDIRKIQSAEADEALLRATLAEAAPHDIGMDRAWAAFSQRIAAPQTRPTARRGVRIRGRLVTLPAIAAALAMAVLLMGAGFAFWAGPFQGSELNLIGQQHLYTEINQSQTAGGLTITVTNVYADEGRTLIAYTINPSDDLRSHYNGVIVASYDLVDQTGHEPQGAAIQCTELQTDGGPIYCLMDLPSFGDGSGVDQLRLTWDIHTVYLTARGSSQTDSESSGWHFSFTLPYLHVNNGSGAYPQLCASAHNPCKR